jgi:hypothetical protein
LDLRICFKSFYRVKEWGNKKISGFLDSPRISSLLALEIRGVDSGEIGSLRETALIYQYDQELKKDIEFKIRQTIALVTASFQDSKNIQQKINDLINVYFANKQDPKTLKRKEQLATDLTNILSKVNI